MPESMKTDGVVKYSSRHRETTFEDAVASVCAPVQMAELLKEMRELDEVRTKLHDLNLIGISSSGIGFGNISLYVGNKVFVISGSGTGEARILGNGGYCLVQRACPEKNEVCSSGPVPPSSESMTHAAVYSARTEVPIPIRCVIHVHSPGLFAHYLQTAPSTPASAAYGSPELARAVRRLIPSLSTGNGFFVLAGHQDGLVFFGDTIRHTWGTILSTLREADMPVPCTNF